MDIFVNYNFIDELSDDRTKGWPMVDSLWKVLAVIATYNFLIQAGKIYMKNRQPYKLKFISLIYNIILTFLNGYVFIVTLTSAIGLRYNILCNKSTRNNRDPLEMKIVSSILLLYMAKFLELLDTLFIVLKKKDKNLSFFHVYHHSSIIFFSWLMVKCFPTGNSVVPSTLNSLVHVVMYSYYALSSLGPKVAKYLWWKKYLTMMQAIQFVILVSCVTYGIVMQCNFYPAWLHAFQFAYYMFFLILFLQFYVQEYVRKKKSKTT